MPARRLMAAALLSLAVASPVTAEPAGDLSGLIEATLDAFPDRYSFRPEERRRPDLILAGLTPISRKFDGLRNDAFGADMPSSAAYERIALPTLILSCEDQLFGTADTARRLAGPIPDARLTIWPEGGHIWLGHEADAALEIAAFVPARSLTARAPTQRAPDTKEPRR